MMKPLCSALRFRSLQLAISKFTGCWQTNDTGFQTKGTYRLCSVHQQPAWVKHIGGTYKALQFDCREDVLTILFLPALTECKENQVIVRVAYTGVCTGDLKMLSGEIPSKKQPIVPGHEISGYVNKVGEKVTKVAVGDMVTVDPIRSCGICENCLRKMPNYCTTLGLGHVIGFQMDGAWAEYCVVSEDQIYKFDPCLHVRYGVLIPTISANLRAWNMVMPAPPDTRFLILGADIQGKVMMGMLHYQGYKNVIITDHCDMDRASVRKYTTCALDYQILSPCKVTALVARGMKRNGIDIIFVSTKNVHLIEQAIEWLRPMGKMVIYSYAPCDQDIRIPGNIFFKKELKIMGAFLNPFSFQLAVHWAKNLGGKYLEFYPLGIKMFRLEDYKKAMRAANDGSITKAVFKLDK